MPDTQVWSCPDWSETYRDLVASLQRGEEPTPPDEPLVFTPHELDEETEGAA